MLLGILFAGIGINELIISNFNPFYFTQILASIYLLVFPGILIAWAFYPKYKNIWEMISYAIGVSVATLMFLGLFINWLLPILRITQPLSTYPVLISLGILLSLFWVYLFVRNKPFPLAIYPIKFSFKNSVIGSISAIFPVLSILGAISLNNNKSNTFTMIMLGGIALYVVLVTILRNKLSSHLFAFASIMIGLSLLLMTSLRGWYITGHDIYLEYYVFQLTKLHNLWSMASFPNPYTACLSITMLPTMIASVTHISDMYIYKILFQVIFAFSVLVTYLFLKKFISPFLAFLGTFIIISLPTFMTDMPMLNRQEIALLFFALLLKTLFNDDLSKRIKWTLFIFLGLGLALSHYSTTYVTLGLFITTSLLYLAINIIRIHPNIKKLISIVDKQLGIEHNKTNVKLSMIILLLVATVTWNFSITHTADGIIQTINSITKDFTTKHFTKAKSDPASYSLLNLKKPTQQQLLSGYIASTTQFARKFNDDSAFFKPEIYSQYPVTSSSQIKLPLTKLGEKLNNLHLDVFQLNDGIKQVYAKSIQLLIVIGFAAIFWYKKYIKNLKKEHILLTLVFLGLIVIQVILPSSSIDYGILRLFQQGLILLVIPLLIGSLTLFSIFNKVHSSIKIYITSFIFVFFFLFLSGFIPQITGGYYTPLNLANSGFYYEAYYTHKEELTSINWLVSNKEKKTPIQADWFTGKKIHTYSGVYSVDGLIPSVVRRNSYIYLSYSNISTGEVMVYVNGAPIYYKFPIPFLDQNKNLIYNNGGTRIYR
jgi:uncharacterized membrane protein